MARKNIKSVTVTAAAPVAPAPTTPPALMGIQQLDEEIKAGRLPVEFVIGLLDARIEKRKAAGKSPITKVIQYRNSLLPMSKASGLQPIPVPTYAEKQTRTEPSESMTADDIADLVKRHGLSAAEVVATLTKRAAAQPA